MRTDVLPEQHRVAARATILGGSADATPRALALAIHETARMRAAMLCAAVLCDRPRVRAARGRECGSVMCHAHRARRRTRLRTSTRSMCQTHEQGSIGDRRSLEVPGTCRAARVMNATGSVKCHAHQAAHE